VRDHRYATSSPVCQFTAKSVEINSSQYRKKYFSIGSWEAMGVHHCHRPSCTKTYMVSGDTTLQDKRSPLEASRDLFARRIMDAGQAGSKRKQPPTMPRVTVKRQKKVTQSDPLARVFETRGLKLLNRNPTSQSTETSSQRFKAHFGVPPESCADVWLRLNPSTLPHKATIEHLLWSFFLLRQYPKEAIK
jgi:hypothetical protein